MRKVTISRWEICMRTLLSEAWALSRSRQLLMTNKGASFTRPQMFPNHKIRTKCFLARNLRNYLRYLKMSAPILIRVLLIIRFRKSCNTRILRSLLIENQPESTNNRNLNTIRTNSGWVLIICFLRSLFARQLQTQAPQVCYLHTNSQTLMKGSFKTYLLMENHKTTHRLNSSKESSRRYSRFKLT